jgi:hypothetical protein
MSTNGNSDNDGRDNDEGFQRMLDIVRARIAEVRAENGGPWLTVDAVEPLPPLKPWTLPTTDEIVAEAIAARDSAIARAEEAWAKYERNRAAYELDQNVRAWRRATGGSELQ